MCMKNPRDSSRIVSFCDDQIVLDFCQTRALIGSSREQFHNQKHPSSERDFIDDFGQSQTLSRQEEIEGVHHLLSARRLSVLGAALTLSSWREQLWHIIQTRINHKQRIPASSPLRHDVR